MGQTISISNDTNVCLHVSLKHLGPLVYQNYLRPGERMERKVAPGFYTIEAKFSLINNVYTEKEKIIPLVGCAVAGVALVGVAAGAAAIAIAGSTAEAAAIAGTSAAAASTVEAAAIAGTSAAAAAAATSSAAAGATVAASSVSGGASAAGATAAVAARTALLGRTAAVARSAAVMAKKLPVATKVVPIVTAAWSTMIRKPEVQTAEIVEMQSRLNKLSLFKMGMLINSKRNRFVIRGGPLDAQVQIPEYVAIFDQTVDFSHDFEPLYLVTILEDNHIELNNSLAGESLD